MKKNLLFLFVVITSAFGNIYDNILHQKGIHCPKTKIIKEWCPIDEKVSIDIVSMKKNGRKNTKKRKGYKCKTYISSDFRCVFVKSKKSLNGVYFKNSKELIDFEEISGNLEEVINPPKLEHCGTNTNVTNQTNLTPPNEALSLWEGCYPGILNQSIHVYIGIAVGSHLFNRLDNNVERTMEYIETIVSEANVIFISQLNVKLHVRKVVISKTSGATSWDNPGCDDTIYTQFDNFKNHERASDEALWHLLDDCYVSGNPIGLAIIGTVCNPGSGYGITYHGRHLGKTWLTFAHEIGHNFGAQHSFEEGQGTTGGIMDYGTGILDNEYQFNTYRYNDICNVLRNVVAQKDSSCKGLIEILNTSRNNNTCICNTHEQCCIDCQYAGTTQTCDHSDGLGYCRWGSCASADCASLGLGPFCGVVSETEPCKKKCSYGPYCIELESNNWIRDGAYCFTPTVSSGTCQSGECVQSPTAPTTPPSAAPTISPSTEPTTNPTLPPTAAPATVPGTVCGNGICEIGEDCLSCSSDCEGDPYHKRSRRRYCCGNGIIERIEKKKPWLCSDGNY